MGVKSLKRVFNVSGDKGGVGKSTVSTSLIDTLLYHHRTVRLVEAENTNVDVGKPYSSIIPVEYLNLDVNAGFINMIEVINTCVEKCVVINNPARSINWLSYGQTFESALQEMNVELLTLWILGRKQDSINALLDYSDALQSMIYPVFNLYFGCRGDYEIWDDPENNPTRELIISRGGQEIIYPACADRVTEAMNRNRWNWSDTDKMSFSHRIEAERFCRAARAALAPIII